MKRLALILLLLAAPSGAATYWVSPTGSTVKNSQYDGSDSTAGKALSIPWANTFATDGDVIRLKPGRYNDPIIPRAKGTSSSPLRFIGDITGVAPNNYVVTNVTLDSAAVNGGRYIMVYGVEAEGRLSVTFSGAASRGGYQSATAANDSIAYCRFRNGGSISTVSNVTITLSSFGEGKSTDKFSVGYNNTFFSWYQHPCQCPAPGCVLSCGAPFHLYNAHRMLSRFNPADSAAWSNNIVITYNRFNLGTSGGSNALQFYWMKSSTFAANRCTLTASGSSTDTHLNTWYDVQDTDIRDNLFYCDDKGTATQQAFPYRYALNVRDNQVGNRWVRDTIIEAPAANRPMKIAFMTSGAFDSTSRNNLWDSNRFRIRGYAEYQSHSRADIHRNNVYVTGTPGSTNGVKLSATNAPLYTIWNDSLVFKHNTVVTFGFRAMPNDAKLTNALISANIFYARRDLGTSGNTCSGIITYGVGTTGTIDSNLVCSPSLSIPTPPDSTKAVEYGGCGTGQIRSWGQDTHSRWAAGLALTDTLWASFDPQPSGESPAISTYWPDGYVGAIPFVAADTYSPVVTIITPTAQDQQHPINGAMPIQWSATDDVGVTSVDLAWSEDGTDYSAITTGLAASGTYQWPYPRFNYMHTYVRVTAHDATGNTGVKVVLTPTQCSPCYDGGEGDDPNRIPE